MQQPDSITCPHCQTPFKLTESLAAPLIEQAQKNAEAKIAKYEAEMRAKAADLKAREEALLKQKESQEEELARRLRDERIRIAADEAKKARTAQSLEIEQKVRELTEASELLRQKDLKLAEAQNLQAETLRKQRELNDKLREADLTVEKRVEASLQQERAKAERAGEEKIKLKLLESEQVVLGLQKKIEELSQKAEQGSQQLQGEALELDIESQLKLKFPIDQIEPIAKGELGADLIQGVTNPLGQSCGSILWELKRTKNWSDSWLPKLRDDQRRSKSDIAILVTHALPKSVLTFDIIEGVWVTTPAHALALAIVIRCSLIELCAARIASEGQQTKAELMYNYLTGPRFRDRVNAITEKFQDMREDLDRERKMMTKQWSKREQQINGLMETTAGMYGDLQGIAGRSLQEVEGLEVKMLEERVDSAS